MIPARHTRFGRFFFSHYARIRLHRNFRCIRLRGEFVDKNMPVLLIANHFSWWDGFIQLYMNDCLFKRKFFVMMLEEQLKRYRILNKAGAFSIKKGTKDMLESIRYCERILSDPGHILLLFPQGEIQSLHTRVYKFERGLQLLLKKLDHPIHLIFTVSLVDYFSYSKPGLTIHYKEYPYKNVDKLSGIEEAYNQFVEECINHQKEA